MIDGERGRSSGQRDADRWWRKGERPAGGDCRTAPKEGLPCPSCLLGELQFDGLFQLVCDTCGRVAESAVFT